MIQFITNHNDRYSLTEQTELVLQAGCRWVQLRMKGATDDELCTTGRALRGLCDRYGATFLLDDAVHLVDEVGADGVHLGKQDMPVDEARRLLGPDRIIGGTANTFEDIERLAQWGADYIGCGPFRFTTTKEKLSPTLGLDGYKRIMTQMKECGLHTPVVAIGGITLADIPDIMATGVSGIAVSGAVLNAADPAKEMNLFISEEEKWK